MSYSVSEFATIFNITILLVLFQCASAVDNIAAFYFNNITMGEAPTSPAAINLARHVADCPNLFPEVRETACYTIICYIFMLCCLLKEDKMFPELSNLLCLLV